MLKEREYYFDNAKFVLIFLVIFGHLCGQIIDKSHLASSLSQFIYIFHMPAFVLVSGYFSKNLHSIYPKRLVQLLAPYLVFTALTAYFSINNYVFLIHPYWMLWFLFSLATWNIMLLGFSRFKNPALSLSIAVLLGIASSYVVNIGEILSLSRTFVFFPFFLAGYYLDKKSFDAILAPPIIKIGVALVGITMFVLIFTNTITIPMELLKGSYSYAHMNYHEWYAGIYRLTLYLTTTLFCVGLFSLIPKSKNIFSHAGRYTLYIYLLHFIVIQIMYTRLGLGIYQNFVSIVPSPWREIAFIPSALILVLLLSSKPIRFITRIAVEPQSFLPNKNKTHLSDQEKVIL